MNSLITIDHSGAAILDAATAEKIAGFKMLAKRIKEEEDALEAAILEEMRAKGIIKVETDSLRINYIAGTMRETFDSKALKKERPDVYDEYVKLSPTKDCVRVAVK